jgi:hypothetical protein
MAAITFAEMKLYTTAKALAGLISGVLFKSDAPDAVASYGQIQTLEEVARHSWARVDELVLAVEAVKHPTISVTRALRDFNTASAKLAVVMGMREGQEILDFDRNDEVALSRNLEKMFHDKNHHELAASQVKVRNQYLEMHGQSVELKAKLGALGDLLRVDIAKLKAAVSMGMVAIKNNNLPMPRAVKKDGSKATGHDNISTPASNPGSGPVAQSAPADVAPEKPESE